MNHNHLSAAQIAYVNAHKVHKIKIQLYRFGILFLFLVYGKAVLAWDLWMILSSAVHQNYCYVFAA